MKSLPNRALSNYDIINFIKTIKIPNFRGVFMRDNLPKRKPWRNECMVVNHDSFKNSGTHWTCFAKENRNVYYFDSFGKLPPPLEVIEYLGDDCKILYNSFPCQDFNTFICGHLCLRFLCRFYNKI